MKYYYVKFTPGMYVSLYFAFEDKIISRPGEKEILVVGKKPITENSVFFFESSYYEKIWNEYYDAKIALKLVKQEKDHHWVSFWYFLGCAKPATEDQYKDSWDYSKGIVQR